MTDQHSKKKVGENLSTKERIAKLHERIERLQAELEDAPARKAGQIAREIRVCKERLVVERTHLISKIDKVRARKLSGSYGSASS